MTILDIFRSRRRLNESILKEFDGFQGDEWLVCGTTCQLPRPQQQRHCREYEPDTGATGDELGRCLFKQGSHRCGKVGIA